MEWLVTDCFSMSRAGWYVLIVEAESLKMIAAVSSETAVMAGETLYPVKNARYLINREHSRELTVIRAVKFSEVEWRLFKNAVY